MALFTSKAAGNWSASGQTTWTQVGVPGNGDTVSISHAIAVDVNTTVGASLQRVSWTQLGGTGGGTWLATGGGSTTKLATGTYFALYTVVSGTGETQKGNTASTTNPTITLGTSQPRVTFPAAPPSGCTYNLYLSSPGGSANTCHLFCTGITGSTVDVVGQDNGSSASFWGNTYSAGAATGGATAYGSAVLAPVANLSNAITLLAAGSLAANSGVSLTVRGDFEIQSTNAATDNQVTFAAGSSLIFDPTQATDRTKANYDLYLGATSGQLVFNGSSGSHCTLKTLRTNGDEAQAYMRTQTGGSPKQGVRTATYLDVIDMGTSTIIENYAFWGVTSLDATSASTLTWSLTHCTFTRSNFQWNASNANWDGNLTFQYNQMVSSTLQLVGGHNGCAYFQWNGDRTSGNRLIDSCSFDTHVNFGQDRSCVKTNNVVRDGWTGSAGSYWPDDTYCNNNVFYGTGTLATSISMCGPIKNCFLYQTDPDGGNSHMMNMITNNNLHAYGMTGCIAQGLNTTGNGDMVGTDSSGPYPTGSTFTFKFNIAIPVGGSGTALASFSMGPSDPQGTGLLVTSEHNTTFCCDKVASGTYYGETVSPAASTYASHRANLYANYGSATKAYAIGVVSHNTTDFIGVPNGTTLFGFQYNGFYNPTTGSSTCNSVSLSTVGYNGVQVSSAGFPNVQIGNNDISGTSSTYDPMFVDPTRNLENWGGTATGGGVATAAGALATLAANPALIAQAGTGLLQWVRAGFVPQNATYHNASYPADAATVDANGTAYVGVPDTGAMAYRSASIPEIIFEGGFNNAFSGGYNS